MTAKEENVEHVSLAEVKNILNKAEKDREELLYEQKNALEHANKFAKLSASKTDDLIKDLKNLEFLKEKHAYKIADLLPTNEETVQAIFAKERVSIGKKEIKKILDIVGKYYTE